ncbi:MAG: hypothetical protein J5I90_19095 [Caldilineales bacterium]|nr:hypothetical protein [Caldilineales bacterium]
MFSKIDNSVVRANPYEISAGVDESIIEKVWRDLDRQVPREQISRVVDEVTLGFQDATVTAFLPILVHRRALEQLRQELEKMDSADETLANKPNSATRIAA